MIKALPDQIPTVNRSGEEAEKTVGTTSPQPAKQIFKADHCCLHQIDNSLSPAILLASKKVV
jgi:hypothetical protein